MPTKKPSEKSRLLSDTDGYDSNAEIRRYPRTVLVDPVVSVNNTADDIEASNDVEASYNASHLTASSKSSRSKSYKKSRSVVSEETEECDILVDGGEPGTT